MCGERNNNGSESTVVETVELTWVVYHVAEPGHCGRFINWGTIPHYQCPSPISLVPLWPAWKPHTHPLSLSTPFPHPSSYINRCNACQKRSLGVLWGENPPCKNMVVYRGKDNSTQSIQYSILVHMQNVERQNDEWQNVDNNKTSTITKRRHQQNVDTTKPQITKRRRHKKCTTS
jgi:hypothetical protein